VNLVRYIKIKTNIILIVSLTYLLMSWSLCVAAPPTQEERLKLHVNQLTKKNRALQVARESQNQKLDALITSLHYLEYLVLKRPFTPNKIQQMSQFTASKRITRAMKSPLPNKKARFLSSAKNSSQMRNLSALFERGPVLIALWATWCKPCVSPEEKAHLSRLRDQLRPYGVPLLSIGVDQWSKIKEGKEKWFYPLWHLKDAHLNLTPEIIFKRVGLGLPLFFLRMPDHSTPYFLSHTLSKESVAEWVTVAIRAKLQVFSDLP
jgi:hypothetical protein